MTRKARAPMNGAITRATKRRGRIERLMARVRRRRRRQMALLAERSMVFAPLSEDSLAVFKGS